MVWGFAGQATIAIASFVASAIVARLLTPHEVGVYAAGMSTMALITVVTSLGVHAWIVRQDVVTQAELAAAFTVNGLLACLLGLALLAVSAGAARLLGDLGVARVLRLLALVPIIQAFELRPNAMLAREMQFRRIALVNMAGAVLAGVCIVGAAVAGHSYMSLAYGVVVGATVNAIGLSLVGRRHVGLAVSLDGARAIVAFGLKVMAVGGVSALAQRACEVLLGRMLGLSALGLYSRASNLANLLFSNVYGTATRIAFSRLAQDRRETGSHTAGFATAFELITGVMWPLVIGLAVLARPFVFWVYGAPWLGAAPVLSILMVAMAVVLCFGMNWELFVLNGEEGRQARYEAARAGVGTVLFVGGASLGLIGAAAARVGDAMFGLLLYLPHMARLSGMQRRALLAIYARGAAITLAAVAPAGVLMIATGWAADLPLPWLAAAVLAGILAWLAAAAGLGHPVAREVRHLLPRHGLPAGRSTR